MVAGEHTGRFAAREAYISPQELAKTELKRQLKMDNIGSQVSGCPDTCQINANVAP